MKKRLKKNVTALVLALAMCVSVSPLTSMASGNTDVDGQEIIVDETGMVEAEEDIVYVYEADDLFQNTDYYDYNHYILMNDIDFSNCNKTITDFEGILDGNGYTIKNRNNNMYKGSLDSWTDCIIKYNYGVIKNLNVECNIEKRFTDIDVAGICGTNNGVIYNCHVSGNIDVNASGDAIVAGITNFNWGSIENCSNSANMTIYAEDLGIVGGICSYANYSSSADVDSYIKKCSNSGDFKIDKAYSVGGICANSSGMIIENCINTGDFTFQYPKAPRDEKRGGIVSSDTGKSEISKCINYGNVSTGVVGTVKNTVTNSYYLDTASDYGVYELGTSGKASVKALTAGDFTKQSSFPGFDFTNVWKMGDKHPELRTVTVDKITAGNNSSSEIPSTGNEADVKPIDSEIKVSYRTHIQTYGWEGNADNISTWKYNGLMSGTSGESKRLEGINIVVNPKNSSQELDLGIQYTTHCQNYGWIPWSADGDMNGTEGESKRLEAIMIRLTGKEAKNYDVYYRVHAQNYGWLDWACNGEAAGTAGYSKRLEGIQIVVVKKGEDFNRNVGNITSAETTPFVAKEGSSPIVNYPATSNTNPVVPGTDTPNVAYRTHVQSYGWQGWKYNGQMSGTSGESKRLEGININLTNKDYDGGIAYTTHVQTYGWQGDENNTLTWMKNGQMSGTSGESKRLEAIKITLTGEMSVHYDIYYRVHAQSYGWLGWAKNGEAAGTAGYSKRLEGIQIVLVPKGESAPSNYGGISSVETEAYISK